MINVNKYVQICTIANHFVISYFPAHDGVTTRLNLVVRISRLTEERAKLA